MDKEITLTEKVSLQEVLSFIREQAEDWKELETYYYCAMMEVETKFKVLNQEFSLKYDKNPIESIKTRMKTIESLADKMIRRGFPISMKSVEDNIFDMAGIRIICSFLQDIYDLADSFLSQDDVQLLQRKDYIKEPKKSGYRGLHLIVQVPIFLHDEKRMVKVEVQLRTIAMDFWASLEHKLQYKKDFDDIQAAMFSEQLRACADATAALDLEMQQIRNRLEQTKKSLSSVEK